MPHLVAAVANKEIPEVLDQLRGAHQCLVAVARQAVVGFEDAKNDEWGSVSKRVRVELPEDRPGLMSDAASDNSFSEVVNQCANMERLMDALKWARRALSSYSVQVCHPTTSSSREPGTIDNDLILVDAQTSLARFEISDVISSRKDGNRKETKDLESLGIPVECAKTGACRSICTSSWPDGRLFLVVSAEFSEYLMRHTRHGLRAGCFHYQEVGTEAKTRVIEIIQGRMTDT